MTISIDAALHGLRMVGPYLPLASWPSAAARLHQTGHSSITQHFGKSTIRSAVEADIPMEKGLLLEAPCFVRHDLS